MNPKLLADALRLMANALEAEPAAAPPSEPVLSDVLDCDGAAELLHLHRKSVEIQARQGRIPGTKLPGGRGWRFHRATLVAWIASRSEAKVT